MLFKSKSKIVKNILVPILVWACPQTRIEKKQKKKIFNFFFSISEMNARIVQANNRNQNTQNKNKKQKTRIFSARVLSVSVLSLSDVTIVLLFRIGHITEFQRG